MQLNIINLHDVLYLAYGFVNSASLDMQRYKENLAWENIEVFLFLSFNIQKDLFHQICTLFLHCDQAWDQQSVYNFCVVYPCLHYIVLEVEDDDLGDVLPNHWHLKYKKNCNWLKKSNNSFLNLLRILNWNLKHKFILINIIWDQIRQTP